MTRIIQTLDEIADEYDVLLCDLWGCLHDGLHPFEQAVAACRRFRAAGGTVLLLTNSPRPRDAVARQLDEMGVPRDCWDVIATSGDSARAAMWRGIVGARVYHIGTPDEGGFFEPMEIIDDPVAIRRVPLPQAEGIVCTGPFDPLADPDLMRPDLLHAKTRGLKLLCANPDIVVDRGDTREWCAGALAALYSKMGGESLYFGKPHPPIYDLARRRLDRIDARFEEGRILAVGDGLRTDILGAQGEGLDSLFVTGGLSRRDTGTGPAAEDQPDPDRLSALLAEAQVGPAYAIGQLR